MNCDETVTLLAADADGEVDSLRSHAIRKHVAGCALCSVRYDAVVELKQRLQAELPYHAAPDALRARLMAEHCVPVHAPQAPSATPRWRWFGGGMLTGGLAACLVWAVCISWQQGNFGEDLSERIVGLHTRATLGNRLIEVASSDRHKLKPWLSARLNYAIPVIDAAQAGFPLAGARIERLAGRPTATLVYRHHDHVIDVFVQPDADLTAPASLHAVRGFNVAAAHGADMWWLATSDLNLVELTAFVQALAAGDVKPASD